MAKLTDLRVGQNVKWSQDAINWYIENVGDAEEAQALFGQYRQITSILSNHTEIVIGFSNSPGDCWEAQKGDDYYDWDFIEVM